MSKPTTGLKQFLRDERGNFAMMFAIGIIPVALSAGIAIDYSMASRYDSRLQAAVDAATLAAGVDLPKNTDAQVKKIVSAYLRANMENDDFAQLAGVPKITIDRKTMKLTVEADGNMKTGLGGLVGIKKINYGGIASIQAAWGGIEAVLVLDNTGSMAVDNKSAQLKIASKFFIDDMMALNKVETRVKVGIVPFAEYVNVGTNNGGASWLSLPAANSASPWIGCTGSRDRRLSLEDGSYNTLVPTVVGVACPAEITPLTADKTRLMNEADSMQTSGNTYIPAGIAWGLRVLSSQAPFTEAATPVVQKRDNITKAMIVMTDGANTISKNPVTQYHDGTDVAQANSWTLQACAEVKKQNVKLFTVTFGAAVPRATKDIIKACASGTENYFDADDGKQLKQAFTEISESLKRLYLTQ